MGTKITALPVAAPLDGSEIVPVVQTGITKRTTLADVIGALVGFVTTTTANVLDFSPVIVAAGNGFRLRLRGGGVGAAGNGGQVNIEGAPAVAGNGGDVMIFSGDSSGGGNGGNVRIDPGSGVVQGHIILWSNFGIPTVDPGIQGALWADPITHIVKVSP